MKHIAHSSQYLSKISRSMPPKRPEPTKALILPIYQTGGIGDLIISLPWLESFKDCGIPVRIYTNYPEVAKLFLDWPDIRANETGDFDFRIISSDVSKWMFGTNFTPEQLPAGLKPKYEVWKSQLPRWQFAIDGHPGRDNDMAHCAVKLGLRRWSLPFEFTDSFYKPFHWQSSQYKEKSFKYITVHDGFDKHLKFDRSMKSWPLDHWIKFIKLFKMHYPEIQIIQLGGEQDTKLPGTDRCLAGTLPFEQSLEWLDGSLLHIDTDSGLVHARHLLGKSSIVLFGPTNIEYFAYPNNINVEPALCGDCWWIKPNWMEKCVLSYPEPICMSSITAERVFQLTKRFLDDL